MKEFKKEDLKFGDIVTLRCEKKGIFIDNVIKIVDDGFLHIDHISENLTNKGTVGKAWDIMKVERYERTAMSDKLYSLKTLYERKEEILDEKEKEYLSNVIKPFRNKVIYIAKHGESKCQREYISICVNYEPLMPFPYFKKGTMYKNMESNKEYTLKELGL